MDTLQDMDYTRFTDETLIQLIISTLENALGELYDRYCKLVYSVASIALSDPCQAEEITQDVFVEVWQKAHTYSAKQGKVATWLMSIARQQPIDLCLQSSFSQESIQVSWQDAEAISLLDG